jgi:hypothetical protein
MWRHAILVAIETGIGRPFYAPQFLLFAIVSAWFSSTRDHPTAIVGAEVNGRAGQALRNSKAPPFP